MPSLKEILEARTAETKTRLKEMLNRILNMPAGPERDVAMLEYECSAFIQQLTENELPQNQVIRDEQMAMMRERVVMLHRINEARRNGQVPDVNELRRSSPAIAASPDLAAVLIPPTNYEARIHTLGYLFNGESMPHAGAWINEVINGRVNYRNEFDRLSQDLPQNSRAQMRDRYLRMALVNEAVKDRDYQRAYTPEALYRLAVSPELEQRHAFAVEAGTMLNQKGARLKELSAIRTQNPFPTDTPNGLARMYFYFLDPAKTPEAEKKNQEAVNRLTSESPNDLPFRKKFTVDVINKMLAVDDETICAETAEDAVRLYGENYNVIQSLVEVPNFLAELKKKYDLPENVVTALQHKSHLAQVYVTPWNRKFEVDASDLYPEIAMADNWDSEFLLTVSTGAARNSQMRANQKEALGDLGFARAKDMMKSEADVPMPEYNGLHVAGKDMVPKGFIEDFDIDEAEETVENVQPEAAGNIPEVQPEPPVGQDVPEVSENPVNEAPDEVNAPDKADAADEINRDAAPEAPVTEEAANENAPVEEEIAPADQKPEAKPIDLGPEPVPPRAPGGLKPLLHRWFGWFQKDYDDYKREMNRYDRQMEERRAAIANADSPLEKPTEKKRTEWRDLQQDRVGEAINAADAKLGTLRTSLHGQLDEAFGTIEARSNGRINRLDYVMIGSGTLRSHLINEYVAAHPDGKILTADNRELNKFVEDSLTNGHVEDLLMSASAKKIPIRRFDLDPVTGAIRPGEKDLAHPFTVADPTEGLGAIDGQHVFSTLDARTGTDLSAPSDARERMMATHDTQTAVKDLNYVHRCGLMSNDTKHITDQLLGSWLARNPNGKSYDSVIGLSRTTLESHTIAYLMTKENMTPEQIRDPNYMPEVKSRAGEYVANLATPPTPEKTREMAQLNIDGIRKINEYVNGKMKNVDFSRDDSLFAPENECVFLMAHIGGDLAQDLNMKMKTQAVGILGSQLEVTRLVESTDSASLTLQSILKGREDEATMLTGAAFDTDHKREHILSGEISRQKIAEEMRRDPSKPFNTLFDPLHALAVSNAGKQFGRSFDDEHPQYDEISEKTAISTGADCKNFAAYAHSGRLRSEFKADLTDPTMTKIVYAPVADRPSVISDRASVNDKQYDGPAVK